METMSTVDKWELNGYRGHLWQEGKNWQGWFKHDELGDKCSGRLWFEGMTLVNYDGVKRLPEDVIGACAMLGFNMDSMN